jgi:haloalkane dehalogenase
MTYPAAQGGATVRRGYVDIGIGQAHYREAGERTGTPIVLLHRTPTSSAHWKRLLPILGEQHWVIAPDMPGMGMSDPLPEPPGKTMKPYVTALRELLDALGVERAVVVGHSTGSATAVHFTADHPERVEKLIIASFTGVTNEAERDALFAVLRRDMSPRWGEAIPLDGKGDFLEEYPLAPLRSIIDADDPEQFVTELIAHLEGLPHYEWPFDAVLAYPGQQARFAEISCPTLFLGAVDSMGYRFTKEAQEQFPGSTFVEVPGTGENAMTHPRELAAAISTFAKADA